MNQTRFGLGGAGLAGAAAWMLAGCQSTDDSQSADAARTEAASPLLAEPERADAPSFEADLLRFARQYRAWNRVSDMANWAPTMCVSPTPAGIQASSSWDSLTHGRKLYYLFARLPGEYLGVSWSSPPHPDPQSSALMPTDINGYPLTSPVGQVIVKEAWYPLLEEAASGVPIDAEPGAAFLERQREQAELFIMAKYDPATPDTDQGWVYAVLSPDGGRVRAFGRIESCMSCHESTGRDRLFGLLYQREPALPAPRLTDPEPFDLILDRSSGPQ